MYVSSARWHRRIGREPADRQRRAWHRLRRQSNGEQGTGRGRMDGRMETGRRRRVRVERPRIWIVVVVVVGRTSTITHIVSITS